MPIGKFDALVVSRHDDGMLHAEIQSLSMDKLPPGEVLVRVAYSSLNFKDSLVASGNPALIRKFPHVPGIDAAGVVVKSSSNSFNVNDEVMVVGKSLGVSRYGGFSQYISVPADWVTHLPRGISLHESMIIGTAGFTAALAIEKMNFYRFQFSDSEFIVSGATGGVGSMAVAILAKLKVNVTAVTRKLNASVFLYELGAKKVIACNELIDRTGRNLILGGWGGAIDTVGGSLLSTLIRGCKENGVIVATGLAESQSLPITVLPFILRGISLLGVCAEESQKSERNKVWSQLAGEWRPDNLSKMAREISMDELSQELKNIAMGNNMGRIIVNISK